MAPVQVNVKHRPSPNKEHRTQFPNKYNVVIKTEKPLSKTEHHLLEPVLLYSPRFVSRERMCSNKPSRSALDCPSTAFVISSKFSTRIININSLHIICVGRISWRLLRSLGGAHLISSCVHQLQWAMCGISYKST